MYGERHVVEGSSALGLVAGFSKARTHAPRASTRARRASATVSPPCPLKLVVTAAGS
jgi:hypothetical protein